MNIILLSAEEGSSSTPASVGAIIVAILLVIALWRIFEKAGEKGWKALIPVYNAYIYMKIVTGSGWKFLLLLIPVFNVIYNIIINFKLAKAFGKGFLFGLGLCIIPNLFTLILGFGSAEYIGPQ